MVTAPMAELFTRMTFPIDLMAALSEAGILFFGLWLDLLRLVSNLLLLSFPEKADFLSLTDL